MSGPRSRCCLCLGLWLAAVSIAPAPAEPPPRRSPLAEARYKAAVKQFKEVWAFYRQSRTGSFETYYWSRLVLESQQDLGETKADRVAALDGHLERMKRLEDLVKRVRKIGFGFSIDVGATEYYRLEAERWAEKGRSE